MQKKFTSGAWILFLSSLIFASCVTQEHVKREVKTSQEILETQIKQIKEQAKSKNILRIYNLISILRTTN